MSSSFVYVRRSLERNLGTVNGHLHVCGHVKVDNKLLTGKRERSTHRLTKSITKQESRPS